MLNIQSIGSSHQLRPRFWKKLFFPDGLYGFENIHEYYLFCHQEEKPYMRLQATSHPDVRFLMLDPFLIIPDYEPSLTMSDLQDIGMEEEGEAYLISIVNIEQWPKCRLNLAGPILIHWQKNLAKQIVDIKHI